MQEWLGEDGYMGYMTGVIIKYLMRWPMKGGVDDLQKARHCLEKLISYMAEREEKPS